MQSDFAHPFSAVGWALTLAWAAVIFYLSTQSFAPDFSHSLGLTLLALLVVTLRKIEGTSSSGRPWRISGGIQAPENTSAPALDLTC